MQPHVLLDCEGIELSRRDDLESLGYSILFLAKGGLPWQGLPGTKEEKRQRVFARKSSTTLAELCRGMPPDMLKFMEIIRGYEFETLPDYKRLQGLLLSSLQSLKATNDGIFDWMNEPGSGLPKYKRAFEDLSAPISKRQRLSLSESYRAQWIVVVSRIYEGIRQRWTRQASYSDLVDWLRDNEWGVVFFFFLC